MTTKEPRTKTEPMHARVPADVKASAQARADLEYRTLTEVVVRFLRAYGEGDPAALAIVAGVSVGAVIEAAVAAGRSATRGKAVSASNDTPLVAASGNPDCKHSGVRPKALCRACGKFNV